MLETIKNLSIIFALNVASVSAIHLMIKAARLKRKRKRDAELKAVEAKAYEQAKRDLEQERIQVREEYKRNYKMLDVDYDRAAMAKPANVIEMY
ncbi:hypothetical protein E5983_00705 [Streptococcus danieliae]|uniref:Uncharacterized protein n=1 Tax=Streptococcus danieliae TaxID=747656 RepID=A0A7X3KBH8_9STRE|nr:hypothetical protein [Streptococcus danieliae]MVX58194.1 hypothetical protein [Streptococcus danieliae]